LRADLRRRSQLVAMTLVASLILGGCPGMPGMPGAAAPGTKGGGAPGKPEVAPLSVGTAMIIRENLAPTLTYSGNVQARTTVNLVPKISARLEKLNADIGDEVKAGDVIAELDHAQLDAQVVQAEAGVTSAQAKLEQTQASAKQEDIDAAQAVVDQSAVKLAQARAGGRPEEVAAARATALQMEARADQVAGGVREEDRDALQAAIDQGEAQQDQLRAQLTSAQTNLSESKYRLDQARAGLGGPGVRPEDIAQAQATLETNRVRLAQIRNPRIEDIRAAELAVDKAKTDLKAAEEARENCGQTSTTTTSRTRSSSSKEPGTTTSRSTSTSRQSCSEAQEDQLDAQVASARTAVQIAENALLKVKNPSPYDIQQAEQAVLLAEANLQKLRFGGTSDVAALELRISQTQAEVDRLQASLDQSTSTVVAAQAKLEAGVNPDPRAVREAVAAAEQARANLARTANPDPFVVQNAQATLEQSQAQLASRIRPFTAEDIKAAAATVDQNAAALLVSKVNASEAIILAPFEASVSEKLLSPGAMATPQTPILKLTSRDVEIVVQVEEARIAQVRRDQPATLSVSAFPGRLIAAVVAALSPSADTRSRTFAVRIVPREQDGALRDGMFAQVNIVGLGQQAVLVPNEAVVTRAGRSQVFVVVNDRVSAREVKLGDTDGKRTAVLEGNLNPGEQVVVTNPEVLSDGMPVVVEQRNIEPGSRPIGQTGTQSAGQPAAAPGSGRETLPAAKP
jgi:RND family efflux transporter MFP subunit